MADCPKCHSEIGNSTRCGCGWRKQSMRERFMAHEKANPFPLGYQQCEWDSGGVRCKYPGSLTTNTHEGGPYYCRHHFGCDDPIFAADVVEASQDYRRETDAEVVARMNAEAKKNLAEKYGLVRGESESSKAYIDRLRAHCKTLKGGMFKRAGGQANG